METTLKNKSWTEILLIDLAAILVIYFIPSISHFSPFPLYYAEPMRLVAIGVYFLSRNNWNALAVAFSLPLFSMLFTGHPIPLKAVLISIELVLNILLLRMMINKYNAHVFIALFGSILGSKVIYYFLKYILLTTSMMSGSLISIPIYIQLLSSALTAIVFFIFLNKKQK